MSTSIERVLDHLGIDYTDKTEQSIRCPVHDDAHASASLNLDKELFNCFACGAGGSAADIMMAREGIDYQAALALVEGITGESYSRSRTEPRPRKRVPPGQGFTARNRVKVSPRRRRVEF